MIGHADSSVALTLRGLSATECVPTGSPNIVRDQYFETFVGHSADDGPEALRKNTALGRPTLLETHRVNFLEPVQRATALEAMREVLSHALKAQTDMRFLSTEELLDVLAMRPGVLVERSLRRRVAIWCVRIREEHRFWALARASGLALLLTRAQRLVQHA
jgi:hypothetical protein